MVKKKSIIFCLFLIISGFPVFAFGLAELAAWEFKRLDLPLIKGMAYFLSTVTSFTAIAIRIATLLGIVCIIWNAFRLWTGTQEVRKASVDIITKFILFISLFNLYPLIVNGVIDTAIDIGMRAGGGYSKISKAFLKLQQDSMNKVRIAQETLKEVLSAGTTEGAISAGELKEFTEVTNLSDDELRSFLEQKGYTIYTQEYLDDLSENKFIEGYGYSINKYNELDAKIYDYNTSVDRAVLGELSSDPELKQAILTMKALEEVLIKKDNSDSSDTGTSKVEEYMYNPFIMENGKPTNILSPGAMIKTAVMVSDIISRQGSMEYSSDKKSFVEKKLDETFQKIISLIMVILMTFGLVAASIFCMIQYIMCIFEYFIVTSVGIIFIPFCLWDGTKSFTAKLVTLFSSYFIKIMVMILCLFWVFSAFIDMGVTIISSDNPISFLSFAHFMFTCLLGWVVTQNAPQIAVTILNGSPQLSMGEFLHAVGTAAAGAHMAKTAAKTASAGMQGAGKAFQSGVRGFQTLDAVAAGVSQSVKTVQETRKAPMTPYERLAAGTYSFTSMMGKGIQNSAARLLTGQEQKTGGISVGGGYDQGNSAKDNSRTHADAVKAARGEEGTEGKGQNLGKQWAEKHAPKTPQPDTSGEGK